MQQPYCTNKPVFSSSIYSLPTKKYLILSTHRWWLSPRSASAPSRISKRSARQGRVENSLVDFDYHCPSLYRDSIAVSPTGSAFFLTTTCHPCVRVRANQNAQIPQVNIPFARSVSIRASGFEGWIYRDVYPQTFVGPTVSACRSVVPGELLQR